jgi:hypothetical protein
MTSHNVHLRRMLAHFPPVDGPIRVRLLVSPVSSQYLAAVYPILGFIYCTNGCSESHSSNGGKDPDGTKKHSGDTVREFESRLEAD